ncbi:MAG: hypothetical protein N2588_04455 [Rhodovarius sp.]|nr:hypothetical protein [Rhodovarius sp.]
MTRGTLALTLAGLIFAVHAAWLGLIGARGALAPEMVDLWGEAIAAAEGAAPVGRIATLYPQLPLGLTTAWEFLFGRPGLPSPSAVAAALAALLAAGWWVALRRAGLSHAAALTATLLLALHPFALWLVAQGPGQVLVAAGLSGLALGLARLRRRSAAPDAALAAGALAVLALADRTGLLFALAAIPFVAVAAPPELLARSPSGLLLILLFPLLAALAGLAFVGLVFGGDLAAPVTALQAVPTDDAGPLARAVVPLSALLLALPLLVLFPILARRRPPLLQVALALAGLAVAAVGLAAAMGGTDEAPLAVVAPALGLLPAAAVLAARDAARPHLVLPLLGTGFLAGVALLGSIQDPGAARLRAALAGTPPPPEAQLAELAELAAALEGREGIMVDLYAVPALIALRGSTAGLIGPADAEFTLALRARRLDAPLVAVRASTDATAKPDAIARAFPRLHADGAQGYALEGEFGAWRLYARTTAAAGEERRWPGSWSLTTTPTPAP